MATSQRILNINLGVLGHIDSGKTSLAKALSTIASTACFDKHPESKERGITLDLGFSSFAVPLPEHMAGLPYDSIQYTLVDCPGHASLIRTIIGGAQIIDLMMLVVDATKGIQTQTAECLVIGEILCDKMVVVLNKIDLFPEAKREASVEKITKRLSKTLATTKFVSSPIIPVSAKPGGPEGPEGQSVGVDKLIKTLSLHSSVPVRTGDGPFLFAVDHCFGIKGQGTVMTGTILNGSVAVNNTIEIPSLKVTKKVKSMQSFRQPIQNAMQGDRVGVCVTQFDPKLLERGLVCSPGTLSTLYAAIVSMHKIQYFKGAVSSKSKFHVTVGYDTVMARLSLFGTPTDSQHVPSPDFSFDREYCHQDELLVEPSTKSKTEAAAAVADSLDKKTDIVVGRQFGLLEFERPVTCPSNSLIIGSRLDTDIHSNMCRIAFHGHIIEGLTDKFYPETVLPKLKVFKVKKREGVVERLQDEYTVIVRSIFKKETNMQLFAGLRVKLSTGEDGVIEGSFGQSGKSKVRIPAGLLQETQKLLSSHKKKGGKSKSDEDGSLTDSRESNIRVTLQFKRYSFDAAKKMIQ
ncbi:selenocysteine-specific elongation factor-like isoform X2 [Corticium candelabrum]|uniref:selenocysteine-specific elongation factor-like isoform X2 n=1 Tax=Corticium candelabrum TaxID=121492 RepID=UPI002E26ACDE|nr:selenocysteine-specific elongation factor-like isoform X2 [Corticium candelabrum]